MPLKRYEVRPAGSAFGIWDNRLNDWCSLDGTHPLRWLGRNSALSWLERCYDIWECTPYRNDEPTPRAYWGRPGRRHGTDQSPWQREGFMTPWDDSMFGR